MTASGQVAGTAAGRAGQPLVALVATMRPRQWLKNSLVVVVPLAAGKLLSPTVLLTTAIAFAVLCAAASATYLVNDVVDREIDRSHPRTRHRPVASGRLGVRTALVSSALLAAAAVTAGFAVRPEFGWTVVAYLLATLTYSLWLKHEPVLELALLAIGFLLRAIAGGTATAIPISSWFLLVAGFGSLFMAAGKRYSELERVLTARPLTDDDEPPAIVRRSLRGYTSSYLRFVWGLAAGVTITAYCLWSFEVADMQTPSPWLVWSVVPFVLGVLRYAVNIDRGDAETPEDAVLRDRWLLGVGLAWLILFGLGAMPT